jgi:hypothetical protein
MAYTIYINCTDDTLAQGWYYGIHYIYSFELLSHKNIIIMPLHIMSHKTLLYPTFQVHIN